MKIAAMNAKVGSQDILSASGYIYEPKLDGYRALCYINTEVRFISRNAINLTPRYPELSIRKYINAKTAILDGEIVAFDKKGNPSFQALQQGAPAQYMVFDILAKNGKSFTKYPLEKRKIILAQTVKNNTHISIIPVSHDGKKLWNQVVKSFEGVIAKELTSKYHPGKRSGVWLKIKRFNSLDAVIVGFHKDKRLISSLALGLYDQQKRLHYIGNVGTGFSEKQIKELYHILHPLKISKKPVDNQGKKNTIWIKPIYVCEVKFIEITKDKKLRSPVFMRLRDDKNPNDCTFKDQFPKGLV